MKNWQYHYNMAEKCLEEAINPNNQLEHQKQWATVAQGHAALAAIKHYEQRPVVLEDPED